jgi:general secretion pathway protein G
MLIRTTKTTVATAQAARPGFTLMEMLVVVAIIVIIAGAATPLVLNYLAQARVDRAKMDIKTIEKAVVNFQTKHGVWPQDLNVLCQQDEYGNPPVLDAKQIIDPWNRPYTYNPGSFTSRGNVPLISSGGPTGNSQNLNNEANQGGN